MNCGHCGHCGNVVFTTYPEQVQCEITGMLHVVGEECDCLIEGRMLPEDSVKMVGLVDLTDESIKKIADELIKRLQQSPSPYGNGYNNWAIPAPCVNCPNHPANGGSGVCHCTLGSPRVT